jgi:glycosyltransferase involved in cell wall biosynthesis
VPLAANRINGEQSFVIVIASYNNARWYKKNLDSVFSQNYSNYKVIYTDDCSIDGTGNLVEKYVREHRVTDKMTLIRNNKRLGSPLENQYNMIHGYTQDDDVVVFLDGDDWLPHPDVLKHLNAIYCDQTVWMTYGQFEVYPGGQKGFAKEVPQKVLLDGTIRDYSWSVTALRTFYAALFKKITKKSLMKGSKFFSVAGDAAVNFSLIEMAGLHAKFIPDVLYVYNHQNPLSDYKIRPKEQELVAAYIRKMPRYKRLEKLF